MTTFRRVVFTKVICETDCLEAVKAIHEANSDMADLHTHRDILSAIHVVTYREWQLEIVVVPQEPNTVANALASNGISLAFDSFSVQFYFIFFPYFTKKR